MLLRFNLAKISFALEIYRDGYYCRTPRTALKSFLAFCCGGWWDRRKGAYDLPNSHALLHFGFLIGDLDRLYLLDLLEYYRFENQLNHCRFLMREPLGF